MIYINENPSAMVPYIDSPDALLMAKGFGCAVFIETWPDEEDPIDAARGVRKTWLEGYSTVSEFYNPDYSFLPPESDYRRTLYWNPTVTPDENGKAQIMFYNNSSATYFNISAEAVTPLGMIGVYNK